MSQPFIDISPPNVFTWPSLQNIKHRKINDLSKRYRISPGRLGQANNVQCIYLLLIYSPPGSRHGHIVSVKNGTDTHYHNYQQVSYFPFLLSGFKRYKILNDKKTPNLKCFIISPHILQFMAHKVGSNPGYFFLMNHISVYYFIVKF